MNPYELIATTWESHACTLHLGRLHGEHVDLLALKPTWDDVDEAVFRGELVPAWRQLSELNDPRLPRLAGAPFRVDGENWVPFVHIPGVVLERVRDRALEIGGAALPFVIAIGRDIAGALAVMHEAGLHHGALDPRVLAVSHEGAARIVIAYIDRIPWRRDVVGWPPGIGYLSPQAVRSRADVKADIYSLGIILHELLCGRRVFEVEKRGINALFHDLLAGNVPSLLDIRPDLPHEIVSLIASMVNPQPNLRPRAQEVAARLSTSLPWAQWSRAQVATELRALIP